MFDNNVFGKPMSMIDDLRAQIALVFLRNQMDIFDVSSSRIFTTKYPVTEIAFSHETTFGLDNFFDHVGLKSFESRNYPYQ